MSTQKKIYVYRHGPKASGPAKTGGSNLAVALTPEGETMMMEAARGHIAANGCPIAVYCSPAVRTYQTGMFFAMMANRNFPVPEDCLLGRHEQWESFNVGKNPTAIDFYNDKPGFVKEEAMTILLFIKRVARGLLPGETAVCVSHGALIEPTVALALKEGNHLPLESLMPEDLREGEAAVFVFDEENNVVEARKC